MPIYVYRAITDKGIIVRNRVEELSRHTLIKKLKRNNLTPIKITQVKTVGKVKKTTKRNVKDIKDIMKNAQATTQIKEKNQRKESFFSKINRTLTKTNRVSLEDIIIFTEDFYQLKKANFNNIHALSTIIENTENYTLKSVLEDVLAGVEAGDNMYTTMEYYSDIFPYIYINMVKVGELSGSLEKSLQEAVEYLDETNKLSKQLKSIFIPNLIQLGAIIILLFVGTIFAVPAIQNVFDAMGSKAQLPALTIWFSNVVNLLVKYWYVPTFIILAIVSVILIYIKTPKGRYEFDYFKYRMPVFGRLIFSLDFLRFSRAMLLNLNNGMRIQDSLEVSKNVVKNYVMLSIIETSINNILVGQSWIEPFEKSNLASPMTTEMLKIGMQTDLRAMMEKLINTIDNEVKNAIKKIMKILPEIVYSIVGIFLIFFVLVVLVPCIEVYMGGWLFSAAGIEGF